VLKARATFARGDAAGALAVLNSVVNPSPQVIAIRDKIVAGTSESIPELEARLEKNPSDASVLGRLCTVLRTSNPVKALDLCRRASQADPQNISHAIGYGAALVQAKKFPEAVELLSRLRSMSPENVTIRANLATALFQLKRYPEAKVEYRWITEKQPKSPAAFYFLAITHDHLTEYIDAMANYQQFLRVADAEKNKLEIDKVQLRLPVLQKQIKKKEGKRTQT
jgi:cytochrome c-type biogenesis protein CcmH/NrfG